MRAERFGSYSIVASAPARRLVALEVDAPVVLLLAAAAMANGQAALVVPPEPRFWGSSRGLYGSWSVISSNVERVTAAMPGEVGLY
jgi:hypothetical protein